MISFNLLQIELKFKTDLKPFNYFTKIPIKTSEINFGINFVFRRLT